jgi:fused signal recognition particle receptor
MLGWFKKKFGKNENQIPASDQENISQTEPAHPEPSPAAEVTPQPVPLVHKNTLETSLSIAPSSPPQSPSDLAETQTGSGKTSSSLFQRLSERLAKTKESLVYRIDTLFLGKKEIDLELLDDLEEILITADIGVNTAQELLEEARRKVKRQELSDPQTLKKVIKEKIRSFITESDRPAELVMPDKGPFIIMVVGVNGVGKTTTIGKIAHKFTNAGQSVLLVAADTFRAAAVAQLKIWGERNKVQVVSQQEGADPSAVVFDAMDVALAQGHDVVIVDTAGRLHTQVNLMEELKKIKRVMGKKIPGAPHEVMLILDATTGQNAISQAKLFNATVDITGLTLTKLDGTAKGGIVVNICRELKIPIRFIGIGEQLEDLRDFDPDEFVEALFQEQENR